MSGVLSPISSVNKTDRHDITEILLKVALNTITLTPNIRSMISLYYITGLVSSVFIIKSETHNSRILSSLIRQTNLLQDGKNRLSKSNSSPWVHVHRGHLQKKPTKNPKVEWVVDHTLATFSCYARFGGYITGFCGILSRIQVDMTFWFY